MKVKTLLFFLILILVSCSTSNKKKSSSYVVSEPTEKDYAEHLASMGADFLNSNDIHEIKLKLESFQFLEQIYERIITNNEIFLSHQFKPQFHVILNKTPFIFSLPHAQFFFSSGLIEKYLKSEDLFVAAMASEIIKSNRNIYEKKMMIPLGFYSLEKMIQIARLKPETKYQINEWTYIILKRSGYEPTAFLNWIQVQNRNTLDFSIHLGDSIGISKEEYVFKNFMTRQGVVGVEKKINEANSSKAFYKLLNNIVSDL